MKTSNIQKFSKEIPKFKFDENKHSKNVTRKFIFPKVSKAYASARYNVNFKNITK